MTPEEEVEFTKLATRTLEPYCRGVPASEFSDKLEDYFYVSSDAGRLPTNHFNMGLVIDAENTSLALCPSLETAVCLAELINYACGNRPFHNPEDSSIIRTGL